MGALSTIGTAPRRARAWLAALAVVAVAGVARAGGPGPAYFVEPGDAPRNSTEPDPVEPPPPAPSATTDVAAPGTPLEADDETAIVPEATVPAAPQEAPGETPPADAAGAEPAPPPPAPLVADDDPRALTEFGNRLTPYGTWVDDPSYGQVWIPDPSIVGTDFAPYVTDGRWAVDAGGAQAWASDYPFGDVVFHYGRWVWTAAGWGWIPGYRYAPAWVAWRLPTDAYAYVGWSPLPPSFVWVRGAPMALAWHSPYYWLFCPSSFLLASTPSLYIVRTAADARSLARHTRVVVPAAPRRGPPAGIVTRMPRATSLPHGAGPHGVAGPRKVGDPHRGRPASPAQSHAAVPAASGARRTRR